MKTAAVIDRARRFLQVAPPSPAGSASLSDAPECHVDAFSADGIVGWAAHPSGVRAISIFLDGRVVGSVRPEIARPDVVAARADAGPNAGFAVSFLDDALPIDRPADLILEIVGEDGSVARVDQRVWPIRMSGTVATVAPIGCPLPADVAGSLAQLRPEVYGVEEWRPTHTESAVDDIVDILHNGGAVRPIQRYAHYLSSMSTSFEFIGAHFDRINWLVDSDSKDFLAAASSPDEMLCIANHLYVLKTGGLTGRFVECGCFKGFSTCCLSHACSWLGFDFDVFDSFAGLPPSADDYYQQGDFRGTLDEVKENLWTFGRMDPVSFHPGYFSESIPKYSQPIACLWMDVDLESSSRDVMGLLPLLSQQSCVFSHECPAETFSGEHPQSDTSEVLGPILSAFSDRGTEPVGSHLVGYLGAFWEPGRGVPVLAHEYVTRIAHER